MGKEGKEGKERETKITIKRDRQNVTIFLIRRTLLSLPCLLPVRLVVLLRLLPPSVPSLLVQYSRPEPAIPAHFAQRPPLLALHSVVWRE